MRNSPPFVRWDIDPQNDFVVRTENRPISHVEMHSPIHPTVPVTIEHWNTNLHAHDRSHASASLISLAHLLPVLDVVLVSLCIVAECQEEDTVVSTRILAQSDVPGIDDPPGSNSRHSTCCFVTTVRK